MAVTIQKKNAVGKTSVQKVKSGKDVGDLEETQEVVSEITHTEPLANVGVSFSHTKNLGNYEALKLSVSLNLPCPPEDIDATFEQASDWCNGKMESLMEPLYDE